ncbi:MAG TPA: hypothetical protein VNQ73_24115 [Ilumatobacter sp.]|nr:hypothetical protein [Ilumatobacter sp.]
MNVRTSRLAAGVVLLALAAGCAEEETGPTTTAVAPPAATDAPGTEAPDTEAPAPTTGEPGAPSTEAPGTEAPGTTDGGEAPGTTEPGVDEDTVWALEYTGGTAGPASGDPYKIGYINAEDFFPENTIGINAAAAFANAELGGIDGRPIEIVACSTPPGDDGSSCATQMANNPDIDLVITGTFQDAHQALFDTLQASGKAVLIGNGLTTEDFTNTAGVSFTAGSPGVVPSLGYTIANLLPDTPATAAVIHETSGAGGTAAQILLQPVLQAAGIDVTMVGVSTTATAAEVQSAMTAAGVDTADVFVPLVTIHQCINVYDSIRALGINPTVVTSGLCYGTPMTDHLADVGVGGDVPDGWYFGGYGYSYFNPDRESGMETYVNKVHQYGSPAPGATTLEYTGFAGPSFANVLTVVKLVNQMGIDTVDSATLDAALRGFTGPMMIQAGALSCGNVTPVGLPIFVALCASHAGIQQYTGGEWVSVADGLNGNPVDVNAISSGG